MKRHALLQAGAIVFAILGNSSALAQSTLEAVQKKGFVQCGVNAGAVAGFETLASESR